MRDDGCKCWSDHEWSEPRLLEAGHHPTRGRYVRYVMQCTRSGCRRTSTRTDWIGKEAVDIRRLLAGHEDASA